MSVQKLKAKQTNHRCSWCGEQALWRCLYFDKTSCQEHMPELQKHNDELELKRGYQTEAEFQIGL